MSRRATRDDVARLAGTSTAVVSYVINDGPRNVSEAKREKVLVAMEQLQYYPNALARSLAATSTRTIGMIVRIATSPRRRWPRCACPTPTTPSSTPDMVTHDMRLMRERARRVVAMSHGTIAYDRPSSEFFFQDAVLQEADIERTPLSEIALFVGARVGVAPSSLPRTVAGMGEVLEGLMRR